MADICGACGKERFVSDQGRPCREQSRMYTTMVEDGRGGMMPGGARKCPNRSDIVANSLQQSAGVPDAYRACTFDTWEVSAAADGVEGETRQKRRERVLRQVRGWVDGRAKKGQGLALWGPPGTGKTHLAVAALRLVMEQRRLSGVFLDWQTFVGSIAFDPSAGLTPAAARKQAGKQVVLVDDMAAGREPTEFQIEELEKVLTEVHQKGRLLIYTTNFVPPGVEVADTVPDGSRLGRNGRIGQRMGSRLREMCTTVDTRGLPDYRLELPSRDTQEALF